MQDVGEQQLLMLLFVIAAELDQCECTSADAVFCNCGSRSASAASTWAR